MKVRRNVLWRGLALVALGLVSSGCCLTHRTLGWTSYAVRVKADPDANIGTATEVLLVWPSAEKHAEFAEAKTLSEARSKLDLLLPGDDYEYAFLGSILPGAEKEFQEERDFPIEIQRPGKLERHCDARQGFVFTTIGEGDSKIDLEGGAGAFQGFLQIHLRRDKVEIVQAIPSYDEWVRYRTRFHPEN